MQANINTFLSSIIVIKNEIIFCFQKRNEWGFLGKNVRCRPLGTILPLVELLEDRVVVPEFIEGWSSSTTRSSSVPTSVGMYREPQTPANGPQAPKNPLHEKGVFESLRHRLMDLSHRKTRSLSLSKVLPEVLEGAP